MSLHTTSGRRGLGFALALTTTLLWSTLPIALKGVLLELDPLTITWVRFSVSALVVAAVLALRADLPPLGLTDWRNSWNRNRAALVLLGVATVFLAVNYAAYIVGLDLTTAADAQVLIQLGPILLALGGIVVFREVFTRLQWLGVAILACGLLAFLGGRFSSALEAAVQMPLGASVIGLAAITWAIYGLAQKQLLRSWSSAHILLFVYLGSALFFTPFADPGALAGLGGLAAGLLAFCSLNTALAYGAFAESLAHWEASRVGAVLALTPVGTLGVATAVEWLWPGWAQPQQLSAISWVGALLVVLGSLLTSLAAQDSARSSG